MNKIAEAIIIIIVGIIILGRAIYVVVANRRRYSLRVQAKCVGYETAVEQIDKTISKNQHNLDKIIEQNALKKDVGKLRGAVYEAKINGKKVILRGKSHFALPSTKDEVSLGRIVKISVNPEDYTDYLEGRAELGIAVMMAIGAFAVMVGMALILDNSI